jgi:hypothetical protein
MVKTVLYILFISTIAVNSALSMFIEGEPQEISVLQAKIVLKLDSFSIYERTFQAICLDGSPRFLEDLKEDQTIKGIWAKADEAWLFSYAIKCSSGTSPEKNTRAVESIMFCINEVK